MTRSSLNSSRSFRLPTALVATGLAAVLVGCGGGSSSTSKTGEEQTVPPAQQQAITRASAAYSAAQKSVAALAVTATPQQRLTAYRAVQKTADDLVKALEASGDTTSQEYKDAMVASSDAKMKVQALDKQITDAADKADKVAAASSAAQTAANELDTALSELTSAETPTQDQVNAVKAAIANLETAIEDPDLPATAKSPYETAISSAKATAKSKQDDINDMKTAANNKKVGLWEAAIKKYRVGTAAQLDDDLKGTSDLEVEYKNNSTVITLDDDKGVPITNTANSKAPDDFTAKRFIIEKDKSHGVIFSSLGSSSTKQTYANYFFTTYTSGTGTAKGANTVIDGITVADNTGELTLATPTQTNTIPNLNVSYFGGTTPSNLSQGTQRSTNFLGIPGTLSCSNSDCTFSKDTNGDLTITGTVKFAPTIPAGAGKDLSDIILTISGADTKYVSFGYWLTTKGSGNSLKHSIDTYAEATGYATKASIGELDGSASYSGGAAGVYVLKTGDDIVANPDLHQGEFVADVELMAQFGKKDNLPTDVAKVWKITGKIDGFESATDSSHSLSAWKLELEADFGPRSTTGENTGKVSTPSWDFNKPTTKGGGEVGTWVAEFYGNSGTATADGDDDYPEAVVGEFNGHFSNGSVVGAFGAEKE